MATSTTPTKEDALTVCPICYEIYNHPKSLPKCLHTFCKSCIQSYASSTTKKGSNGNGIHCPVCREYVVVDINIETWVNNLPNNHLVVSLIDRNKMVDKNIFCDSCLREDLSVQATDWCPECSDKLCKSCVSLHKKVRLTMEHKPVTLLDSQIKQNKRTGNMFCDQHPSRKLEVYCFDHDSPCCLMCATVSHRKCDQVSSLEECAKSADNKEAVIELQKSFTLLEEECVQKMERLTKENDNFVDQSSNIKQRINTTKKRIFSHLDSKETEIVRQLSAIEKERALDFTERKNTLQTTQNAVKLCLGQLKEYDRLESIEAFLENKRCEKERKRIQLLMSQSEEEVGFHISLKIDSLFETFSDKLGSLGEIQMLSHKIKWDFLKEKIVLKKEITLPRSCITDVEVIDDTHVVAVCQSSYNVYLSCINGTLLATLTLSGTPWAITNIKQNKIGVTIRSSRNAIEVIKFNIEGNPSLSIDRIIDISVEPYGIAFCGDHFIVLSSQRINKIKEDGTIVSYVQANGNYIYGLYVNANMNVLYCDHTFPGQLYCIKNVTDASLNFEFSHDDLKRPLGVTSDPDGNIYVVGYSSNNVFQLKPDGTLVRQIICNDSNVVSPYGVRVTFMDKSPKLLLAAINKILIYTFQG